MIEYLKYYLGANLFIKIFFLLIFSIYLHASNILNKTYYINSDDINISTLIPDIKNDIRLFSVSKSKYTKRIKTKLLVGMLQKHGYKGYHSKSRYIKFIKNSPVNLSNIKKEIIKEYKNKYHKIDIQKVTVRPRGYISSLPKDYKVYFKSRDYLSHQGIIGIKGSTNKKIFFDYQVIAKLPIYIAKHDIRRKTALSLINTTKKTVLLDKFKAKPIQQIKRGVLQSKRNIKKGKIITDKNSDSLSIVRKNSTVSASLESKNIFINFSAKSLQDGKLNDIITIQKSNGKKFKAVVIGKGKVEIR